MAMVDPAVGEAVCAALREQAMRLKVSLGDEPVWSAAQLREQIDPYSRAVSVQAVWRGGARYGQATFFPDGRVFAEYQVLAPHPTRPGCHVDTVQVWGTPAAWRGEATLIELPVED